MSDVYYKSAKEVIVEVLGDIEKIRDEKRTKIDTNWSYIVGKRISNYAFFSRVEKRKLYIATSDAHYIPLIKAQYKNIINKYNEIFPEDGVKYISIFVS